MEKMPKYQFEETVYAELKKGGKKPPYKNLDVMNACRKVLSDRVNEMKAEFQLQGDLLNGEEAKEVTDKFLDFLWE